MEKVDKILAKIVEILNKHEGNSTQKISGEEAIKRFNAVQEIRRVLEKEINK